MSAATEDSPGSKQLSVRIGPAADSAIRSLEQETSTDRSAVVRAMLYVAGTVHRADVITALTMQRLIDS